MKKTFILTAIAALVLASSCNERVDIPSLGGENVISLDLVYGDPATRAEGDEPATTDGVGAENTVNSVQYFIYNDVKANPIYSSGRIENPALTGLKYSVTLVAGEGGVPDLKTMFKNGTCTVFGVFNSPEIADAPLATVKNTDLSNTFAHEGAEAGAATRSKWVVNLDEDPDYPKYFVMVGELELSRAANTATYAAKGTVEMKRVAAKINVDLKIQKSVQSTIVGDNNTWEPILGGTQVRIYLQNAVKNAVIGGASATPVYPTKPEYFTYKDLSLDTDRTKPKGETVKVKEEGNYYVVESQFDFYTYPSEWEHGADNEPFIKVILPWRTMIGATSQKEVYYKIMLPTTKFESNKFYKYTVELSVLGNEGEPQVELKPLSAMVVDWQGGGKVNGTLSAAKYLSVERGVVTATSNYDTAEGRFDFYTPTSGTSYAASDPVTATILEIKQKNLTSGDWEYLFQNGAANTEQITKRGFTQNQVQTQWVQKVGDNYLQLGHQLNSDLTSTLMDVTPYYYTVVLSLPTEIDPSGEYAKTVTFVQWPEVYVVEDPNSNGGANSKVGVFINGSNSGTTTWYKGDYNTWEYNHSIYNLGGANGISANAGNKNGNMYILTVSVSKKYTIGDPRKHTDADNERPEFRYRMVDRKWVGGLWNGHYEYTYGDWVYNWAPGRWTEDPNVTDHVLTYYYPASSENTEDMIAPKIRVASSYGVCSVGDGGLNGEDSALLRCATYQEDGIPAGRWRLPTLAEVEFICTLSSLGRIPYLFGYNRESQYWGYNAYYHTANGTIRVENSRQAVEEYSDAPINETSVRCVYDEWFWGDATTRPVSDKTKFTWGDRNY